MLTKGDLKTQLNHSIELHPAVESIVENGCGGLLESIKVFFNEPLEAEEPTVLEAGAYERTESRLTGFKIRRSQSRMGLFDLRFRRFVEAYRSIHRTSKKGHEWRYH